MKMEEVEVFVTKEAKVAISQPCFGQDDSVVLVAPEQIDVLIDWLKKTKVQALAAQEELVA